MEYNIFVPRIIRSRYSFVNHVYAIKSNDDDFDEIIESKGGRVVHPTFWTDPIGPIQSMKQYGDCHPDVESPLNNLGCHPDTSTPFAFSPPKTTPSFFEDYYLYWFLMPTTRVMTVNGRLLMGIDEIVANQHLLPPAIQLIRIPSPSALCDWSILCEDVTFSSDSKYKVCEFD